MIIAVDVFFSVIAENMVDFSDKVSRPNTSVNVRIRYPLHQRVLDF